MITVYGLLGKGLNVSHKNTFVFSQYMNLSVHFGPPQLLISCSDET